MEDRSKYFALSPLKLYSFCCFNKKNAKRLLEPQPLLSILEHLCVRHFQEVVFGLRIGTRRPFAVDAWGTTININNTSMEDIEQKYPNAFEDIIKARQDRKDATERDLLNNL